MHPLPRRTSTSSSTYYTNLTKHVSSPPQSPSLRSTDLNPSNSPLLHSIVSVGASPLEDGGAQGQDNDPITAKDRLSRSFSSAGNQRLAPSPGRRANLSTIDEIIAFIERKEGNQDLEQNLKVVWGDVTDVIREALESHPEMCEGIWKCLKGVLEEKRFRDKAQTQKLCPVHSPTCAEKPVTTVNCYGDEFVDLYSWLTDKESTEVLQYIDAENTYTDECMASTKTLRKILYNEFVSRLDESEESARVTLSDNYTYYSKKLPGEEYRVHCRVYDASPGGGVEEVYLDENVLAQSPEFENANFFRLGFVRHSPDCTKIAYGVDCSGNERYTAYFLDLSTKKLLPDKIEGVYEQFEFSNDGNYVFYLLVDEGERASSFWRHRLSFANSGESKAKTTEGTANDESEDVLLYEEKDEMYCLTLTKTCNGRFLLLNSAAQITSETRLVSANRPLDRPLILFPRRENIQYTVESHGNHFYVLTNEGSKNNWLFRVRFPRYNAVEYDEILRNCEHVGHLLPTAETVIPHRDFVLIEDFQVRIQHLIVFERSNCLQNVRVVDLSSADRHCHASSAPTSATGSSALEDSSGPNEAPNSHASPELGPFDTYHYVSFGDVVYSLWPVSTNEEVTGLSKSVLFDTNVLRYTYTSFIQPKQVIDYNMDTRTYTVVHEEKVSFSSTSPPYDKSLYTSRRLFATGIDGTAVPISLVYRRDLLGFGKDMPNPLLLHGYGAYGYCINPIFSSTRLSLLDRGFVYAVAHIRGGADMGNAWYEDGKLSKKVNTFLDFISCAEYLIKEGYTSPSKLAVYGRSAGGLLMGAVVNMRPDLFRTVLTEVPFVDVINTMFDASIPWTAFEYEEWGNPATDRGVYNVMRSYCPYSNIRHQDYPNMLVVGGMNDPRVAFFEPLKFVARLRKFKKERLLIRKAEARGKAAKVTSEGIMKEGGENNIKMEVDDDEDEEDTLLLLKMDDAGHGGNSGQYSYLEDLAFEYAFLISTLEAHVRPIRDMAHLDGYPEEENDFEEPADPNPPASSSSIRNLRERFAGVFQRPSAARGLGQSAAAQGHEYRGGGKKGDRAQTKLYQWLKNWM